MNSDIREIIEGVKNGTISTEDAVLMLKNRQIVRFALLNQHVSRFFYFALSKSSSQILEEISLGIRQSPRGERETLPTFTPSGKHERLNC